MTVHVIEDDFAVCDALTILLNELGHDVRAYASAEEFLSDGRPVPTDTVVVDLGLPGMAGTAVVSHLNESSPPPRVIVITGKSKTQLRQIAEELSDLPVLRKPISYSTLAEHFRA